MAIQDSDGGEYKFVVAKVRTIEERVDISYQISEEGAPQGSDVIDDPSCVDWTDNEVRDTVAAMLDIDGGVEEIVVAWE